MEDERTLGKKRKIDLFKSYLTQIALRRMRVEK
jgi:hypothetical protein